MELGNTGALDLPCIVEPHDLEWKFGHGVGAIGRLAGSDSPSGVAAAVAIAVDARQKEEAVTQPEDIAVVSHM